MNPYSKALFQLASSSEEKKTRLHNLKMLNDRFESHTTLKKFFSSPTIDLEAKKQFLEKLPFDEGLRQFLALLVEKNRLFFLSTIIDDYEKLLHQAYDIIEVKLTTAVPIDSETKVALLEKLKQLFKKNVDLKEFVDESLIGGGFLTVNNMLADFSIKGELEKLRMTLLSRSPNVV